MGVDIMTYRASIGTFKHIFGYDVVVQDVIVNLSFFRQIIMYELICVILLIVLFGLNLNTSAHYSKELKDIPHGLIWGSQVVDTLLQLSVTDMLEFIGHIQLLNAVLLDLKTTTGKTYFPRREEKGVEFSKANKFNFLRHTFMPNHLCHVCIGSVCFIGMLLLMAGVESNPGPTSGHEERCSNEEGDLIKRLQLSDYFPSKINIFDVLAINQQKLGDLKGRKEHDLPWILLSRLVLVNDSAFCLDDTDEVMTVDSEEYDETSSDEENGSDECVERKSNQLNYLDVFLLTFQCCSPMMKQRLIQKMFLCRFAVPFLISSLHESKQTLSMWPIRSLVVETCFNETGIRECCVLELKSKCVAFCRIGRPQLSKSQMLNRIISDNNSKTFFNRNCQSGNVPKTLCLGYIETFWLPHTGNGEDTFDDASMFMNMRGCLKKDFSEEVTKFVSEIVDNITVFIQKKEFSECQRELANIASLFKSVNIIIVGRSKIKIKTLVSDLSSKENCNVSFVETYDRKNKQEKPDDDITKEIVQHIKERIKNTDSKSLENRLKYCKLIGIETDEQSETCADGREKATKFCEAVNFENDFLSLKETVTPIQSKVGCNLGTIFKEMKRSKDYDVQEERRAELSKVRENILTNITKPIKDFIEVLDASHSVENIDYFIAWVDIFLSRKSRAEISKLKLQQRQAWDTYHKRKHELPNRDYDGKDYINILESNIGAASFSVEHIFREIGLIYDTVCELKRDTDKLHLPSVKRMASIIGKLVARGRQFELIDGDTFYLAYNWLTRVLSIVDEEIYFSKVSTMSVLGVQSSGKSTLLNAMFGAMFPTSAGQCTRGIHGQLVPFQDESDASAANFEYKYVLVLDTEGLCPTEIVHKNHEHDNELATLITGLGDVTIVNVMGENTQEIRDILQIVIHAFLRLKITNKELELNKKCSLVQQNISSMSAESHLNAGLNKLISNLDEMAQESARYEGIKDILTFDQVIKFDSSSDVWYLNNVWDGHPPFARISRSYSQKINKIKLDLIEGTFQLKLASSNNLENFALHTYDLWQGVINESFVFSFRNSLERRAYLRMDEFIQDNLLDMEKIITGQIHLITQEEFCKCRTTEEIQMSKEGIDKRINEVIDGEKQKADKYLNNYFDTCDDRIIVIQWKENQILRVGQFFDKIRLCVNDTIEQEKATLEKNLHLSDRRRIFRESLLKEIEVKQKDFKNDQQITDFF